MTLNPVQIESLFLDLTQKLPAVQSKRARLELIFQFIEKLPDPVSAFESYLEQLVQHLPLFDKPLEYTGIPPEELEFKLNALRQVYFKAEVTDPNYLNSVFVNIENIIQIVYGWVGENRGQNDENTRLAMFVSKSQGRVSKIHSVLIPVLEKSGECEFGRLRNLQMSVVGLSPKQEHDLLPLIHTMGVENELEGSIKKPVKATNALLEYYHITSGVYWQTRLTFEQKQALHSGDSANLAISGLFFCTILEAMERKEQFRVNPGVAITGDITEDGRILPVDENSFPEKTKAVFFSWAKVMVVPAAQLGKVFSQLEILKSKFPNRELVVIGATQLSDLFYDRRVVIHSKKSNLEFYARKVWKRKFSVVAVLIYVITAIAFLGLLIGPIDKNPVAFERSGEVLFILNERGRTLYSERISNRQLFEMSNRDFTLIEFIDVDDDGENEIIKTSYGKDEKEQTHLSLLSADLQDTLWSRELIFDIPYESHPNLLPNKYSINEIKVRDYDSDGDPEILVTLMHRSYFPSLLLIFESKTGETEKFYSVPGYMRLRDITDLESDGRLELILSAELKGHRLISMIILPDDFNSGHGPLGIRYQSSLKETKEKVVIGFPQTPVGNYLRLNSGNLSNYGLINYITGYTDSESIDVTYFESIENVNDVLVRYPVIYTFDYNLNIINVGTGDNYDVRSEQLYREKKIPFLPDHRFLETYKDSLLYWNGTEFQREPTVNKKYLELVGEDSSYYKGWYFN